MTEEKQCSPARTVTDQACNYHLNRVHIWIIGAIFLFVGFLLFFRILDAPPILDDYLIINSRGSSLLKPFFSGHYYRPFINFSGLLTGLVSRDVFLFNLTNIVVHIINSILLFILISKILKSAKWLSAGFSLLFFVHPAASTSVTWIAGRCDLFALCFFLAALSSVKSKTGPILVILTPLLFLFAVWSKETTYPGVIVLFISLMTNPISKRLKVTAMISLIFCTIISLVMRAYALESGLVFKASLDSNATLDLLLFFKRIAFYNLRLFLWDPLLTIAVEPKIYMKSRILWIGLIPLVPFLSALLFKSARLAAILYFCFLLPAIPVEISIRYLYLPLAPAVILGAILSNYLIELDVRKLKYKRKIITTIVITLLIAGCLLYATQTFDATRIMDNKRTDENFLALKIAKSRSYWLDETQIYEFCSGLTVYIDGRNIPLVVSQNSLRYHCNNQSVSWLSSLENYSSEHPLAVYYLKGNTVIEKTAAKASLDTYFQNTQFSSNLRKQINVQTHGRNSFIMFTDKASLMRYKYLQISGKAHGQTPRKIYPTLSLGTTNDDGRKSLVVKTHVNTDAEFDYVVFTPDIGWTAPLDLLELKLDISDDVATINATLCNQKQDRDSKKENSSLVLQQR